MRGSGVWRVVLVVAIVFAAVWACVIAWWRMDGTSPDAGRMLLWLVVVPVAVLATFWAGARLRRRRAEASGAAAGNDGQPAVVESGAAPVEQMPLAILAASVHLPCGSGTGALAQELASLPRPGLHPELRDRDGLPVLAAFAPELDTSAVAAWLGVVDNMRPAPEQLRAVALLEPVAEELFEAAARLLPPVPEAEERVVAGLRRRVHTAPGEHGRVHVVALVPQDFPPALRQACAAWLRGLAADCGVDPGRSSLEVMAESDADATWRRIGRLLDGGHHDSTQWQLLLAAGSAIGERGVHALASAAQAERVIPGEGAAGVLLGPHAAFRPMADGKYSEIAALRSVDVPAETPARRAARDTAGLLADVMQGSGVLRDDIAMVVSDADQRPNCSVEAAVAASAACPDLDPVAGIAPLGVATGHLGHVAPLALLALASARVDADGAPVLALSVTSSSARTAVLLRTQDQAVADAQSTASGPDAAPGVAA